jgi:nitric oxide reductase subunit B
MHFTLRLWPATAVAALLLASVAASLWAGKPLRSQAPERPLPTTVVITDGQVLYTGADIEHGRRVWGGLRARPAGTTRGHEALRASDWSGDWLRREATTMLELLARDEGAASYAALGAERQLALKARVARELGGNTHDPATGAITVSWLRATAMEAVASHYVSLFSNDPATAALRADHALPANPVPDMEARRQLTAYIWWLAWAEAVDHASRAAGRTQEQSRDALGWLPGPLA